MHPICDRPILSVGLKDETRHSSLLLHLLTLVRSRNRVMRLG
ncbi:hypothetical protein MC7420_6122 [Coleofasciculus chthonoplastes PCC 7420]|uniref:Uncharacterized protein n=1 Tax=Coleofasciculus chthonoplastes PCC 7420 TaxID=118168 RepID=B4VU61_9CYAN|nr:hypothetical protein MC7420_6122 [Coleofasciculus chthonoplastes PCC 7420]